MVAAQFDKLNGSPTDLFLEKIIAISLDTILAMYSHAPFSTFYI